MQFPECRKLNEQQEAEVRSLISLNVSGRKIIKYIDDKYGITMVDYDVRNKKKAMRAANGDTEEVKVETVFRDILTKDPGDFFSSF